MRLTMIALCALLLTGWMQAQTNDGRGVPSAEEGVYTQAQAERGSAVFRVACAGCHSADAAGTTRPAPGAVRSSLLPLGGSRLARWGNARDLYDKMRRTMPAGAQGVLSRDAYVDILAFLLRELGVPAGSQPLVDSVNGMRSIMLAEKGFTRLFNGRDFTGIRFMIGNYCAPPPAGCGRTEPGSTFRVENGAIVSTGKPLGYWYPDRRFLDFTLRFEYRYIAPPDMDAEERFFGNSGYLIFIDQHRVWPKSIEVQGQHAGVLGLIPLETKAAFTVDEEARARALKPFGQWNALEIESKGGRVRSSLNGALVSTISQHEFTTPGYIGFQSESAEIQWRNIRIRPE